ncbi:MAG: phosphoribosylanthranilate isomerase [Chloroflexi bacterium]|nr:phosphoribosylanthranilate isomerase [Chloroflexota bacterium]
MSRTRVKICGIKTVEQAAMALEAGADFLGFIFYPPSHRYVAPRTVGEIVAAARSRFGGPDRWQAVGVFVDEPLEVVQSTVRTAGLDFAQLCGAEVAAYAAAVGSPVIRVVHVDGSGQPQASTVAADHGAARLLLDAKADGQYGGTGTTYPWPAVRAAAAEAFLAGGLTPGNVAEAIEATRPWAVDVSSGVESCRVKDPDLIRAFISEVRRVDLAIDSHRR